jgi:hypothetical protein
MAKRHLEWRHLADRHPAGTRDAAAFLAVAAHLGSMTAMCAYAEEYLLEAVIVVIMMLKQ